MKLFSLLPLVLAPLFSAAGEVAPQALRSPGAEAVASTSSDVRIDQVLPFDTDVWTMTLSAGQGHQIIVDGDGSSDLDAYLYDENGNLVAMDEDYTDFCVVGITPRWTGTFRLHIVNRGASANRYVLTLD